MLLCLSTMNTAGSNCLIRCKHKGRNRCLIPETSQRAAKSPNQVNRSDSFSSLSIAFSLSFWVLPDWSSSERPPRNPITKPMARHNNHPRKAMTNPAIRFSMPCAVSRTESLGPGTQIGVTSTRAKGAAYIAADVSRKMRPNSDIG